MSAGDLMRVGVVGFGTIGGDVAGRLIDGAVTGARLVGVASRSRARAEERAAAMSPAPPVVELAELVASADVIVETATAAAFPDIARAVLEAGKVLVPVSVSAFPRTPGLEEIAVRTGGRIVMPSGAVIGLDAVRAAAQNGVTRSLVRMRVTPESLHNEDYVKRNGIVLDDVTNLPLRVFYGTVREAAEALPHHCNNPVTLALAGIGFDRTEVEVVAEGGLPGFVAEVEVDAECVSLRLSSQSLPSLTSPRTSQIVGPSVIAAIRSLVDPIRVGS